MSLSTYSVGEYFESFKSMSLSLRLYCWWSCDTLVARNWVRGWANGFVFFWIKYKFVHLRLVQYMRNTKECERSGIVERKHTYS